MLYSQLNAPDACLKITTTSSSDGILYVQLRIDPDSEETAVVKKVAQFVVDEEHQRFSGTEVRLSIPCPGDNVDIESVADSLALYFQSLRYTAPPFVGVQFSFDVGEVSISVDCQHGEEPIDRFAADLGVNADDILYAVHDEEAVSISCLGVMLGKMEPSGQCDIEICLLRYANHAPLINGDDIFICGITKGVKSSKLWKKYGLRCQRTSLHVVNQLVAAPLRASAAQAIEHADSPARLVLAIDISIGGSERSSGLKYGNLKKSTLDASYTGVVQTCCSLILQQLADAGLLRTPQQLQDRELLENFAPLISRSIAAIVMQPQKGKTEGKVSKQQHESSSDHFNEELIQQELQAVLRNCKQSNMSAIGALRELEKDKKGPNNAGLKTELLCSVALAGVVPEPANPDSPVWPRQGRHQLCCEDAARGANERGGEGAGEQGLQLQPDPGHGLHGVAAAEHALRACRGRCPSLLAFLLLTLDHDHANEGGSASEEQHEQHRGDGDRVVVRQEELLDDVPLIDERLSQQQQQHSAGATDYNFDVTGCNAGGRTRWPVPSFGGCGNCNVFVSNQSKTGKQNVASIVKIYLSVPYLHGEALDFIMKAAYLAQQAQKSASLAHIAPGHGAYVRPL
ncbi:hypothetical protein ON010_g10145 [Phytophthora cinnamomi]|nr:hypothetical protein ON010_g10145 [Phytophthora cinnamomi]